MLVEEIAGLCPVIPVLTIHDIEDAVPLARALVAGGLSVLEVTLRTPVGEHAIARIAGEVEGAVIGAGTVLDRADLVRAVRAGARFLVSPGLSDDLVELAELPLLPGVATPSDIMRGLTAGLSVFKFFPAVAMGGVAALRELAGPFPMVRFSPTGGIDARNAAEFLALPNVVSVGGSWLAPTELLRKKDWTAVTRLAMEAVRLKRPAAPAAAG